MLALAPGRASLPDPSQPIRDLPNNPATATNRADLSAAASGNSGPEAPQPSEADVAHALVDVEQATKESAPPDGPIAPDRFAVPHSGPSRSLGVILYLSVGFALIMLLGWTVKNGARRIRSSVSSITDWGNGGGLQSEAAARGSSSQQAEAETLLERLASGDSIAADQILSESDRWIGETQRTVKANQLVNAALNQRDLHLRGAALQATLALDGVSRDAGGLSRLQLSLADRNTRAWALWMLGALGNREVEQKQRVVQTLEGYLDDSDARTRSGAVYALGLVATDETVPMMLERFRDDPSPVVQESAACGLAEAGMYTQEQRMVAAASFVAWMDDAQLSAQQKGWMEHALRDISGLNFGTDAPAWRQWYSGTR